VLGSSAIGLLFPLLYVPTIFLKLPLVYERIIWYVILPNLGFVNFSLHPFVYGLYFKQIREPMIKLLKRITFPCKYKSAAIAPLPQTNRITWIQQNNRI